MLKRIFYLSILCHFVFIPQSLHAREFKRVNLYTSFQDPIIGDGGFGMGIHMLPWLRLNTGINFWTNSIDGGGLYDISNDLVSAVFWMILLGQVKFNDIKDFLGNSGTSNKQEEQSITSKGLSLEFIYPHISFAPMFAIGYAHLDVKNNGLGLKDNEGHIFYKIGFDYQGPSGLYFSAGISMIPDFPKSLQFQAFARLGWSFF